MRQLLCIAAYTYLLLLQVYFVTALEKCGYCPYEGVGRPRCTPDFLCIDPSESCIGGVCCTPDYIYMDRKCPDGMLRGGSQAAHVPYEMAPNDNSTAATTSNLQNQLNKIEDELQKMKTMLSG